MDLVRLIVGKGQVDRALLRETYICILCINMGWVGNCIYASMDWEGGKGWEGSDGRMK